MENSKKKSSSKKSCLIFLLSVVFLCGCNTDNRKTMVISRFETNGSGCEYTVETNGVPRYIHFNDDCGKFQIGDTVRWAKKNY